jgi:hypothetical protein
MLSAPVVVVGRCDMVLPDDTVSSHHAEISTDGVTYTVRDLGSRNGTWVNRRKIVAPCPLNPGDQIAFGQVVCAFRGPGGGTRAIAETQLAAMVGPQPATPPAPWAGPSPLMAPSPDELDVQLRFAIDRNEVPVRFLRVQDVHTGRQVSAKMIGDPSGAITVGDVVAVWGVQTDGDLVVQAAYNYTTDVPIRLKV